MVAPALIYSNHELSTAIDSTHAFEGPEKLLEIWFYESKELSPINLRDIKFDTWIEILNLVHCEVLSKVSSNLCDAFLLSESSLFVFPHKIILKTCGTTTTLACLDLLFETVNKELLQNEGLKATFQSKNIYQIFYSRRSFMFPDRQIHVHGNWQEEVKLLNQYFNNGKSYIVGNNTNWHLYVGGNGKTKNPVASTTTTTTTPVVNDCTLEIIMTQLSLEASQQFYTTRKPGDTAIDSNHDLGHDLGQEILKQTGLNELFKFKKQPTMPGLSSSPIKEIHDGFAFTPCGFSSNSINESDYYTIHVTPEPGWSYASFETNMIGDYKAIVDKCINVFQPGQFMVTFLTNTDMEKFECCLDDYKVNHREELDVEDYKLYFVEFVRQ
ncbi:S-adenosylmethionine decarboxylase proenzyme [Candida albicans SC5314]|nr:S-adenosylmethionine decarboxylase proenzyme [Candida albicans SC5314]KHC76333.1 S-adenosylmethionine decarboxylase proenzyme [Candida albicans SC5314]